MLTSTTSISAEVSLDMFGFNIPHNSSLMSKIFIGCCDLYCCLSTQCKRLLIKEEHTISWPLSLHHVPGEQYLSLCNNSLLALGPHLHQVLLFVLLQEGKKNTVNQSLRCEGVCRKHADDMRWSPEDQKTSEQPFDGGEFDGAGRFCMDTKRSFGVVTAG